MESEEVISVSDDGTRSDEGRQSPDDTIYLSPYTSKTRLPSYLPNDNVTAPIDPLPKDKPSDLPSQRYLSLP